MKKTKLFNGSIIALLVAMLLTTSLAVAQTTTDGLNVTKTVTPDPNVPFQYNVQLEAWSTGTTQSQTKPADIVLVIDTYNSGKLSTIQDCAKNIINYISTNSTSHRIAIVKYNDDDIKSGDETNLTERSDKDYTTVVKQFVEVNESGKSTLNTAIDGLVASSYGSNVDYGLKLAIRFFASSTETGSPTESRTNSSKRIIVIGGTEPRSYKNGQTWTTIAENSFEHVDANFKKNVEVFYIDFSGTNDSDYKGVFNGISSNYLNPGFTYYPTALNLGTAQSAVYYQTSFNDVIKNNLLVGGDPTNVPVYTFKGTSNVSDVIPTPWSAPTSATVKIAKWNGSNFNAPESAGISASISGNTVSVSGFDFNANYVGNHVVSGSSTVAGGYKLIVTYPIKLNVKDIASNTSSVNVSGSGSGLSDDGTLKSEFPDSTVTLYTLNLSRTNLNAGESATYTVTKGDTTVGCCSITRPKNDTDPNYTGTACLKFSTSGTYTVTETIWNYGMSSTQQVVVTFSDSNPTITKSFSTTSKANDARHAEAQKTFSFN